MDFAWSEEQRQLFDAVADFAGKQLNENLVENDRHAVFNRAGWQRCGEFGIQGLPVPEEYGGLGRDALTSVGALERLGYACRDNGLVFSLHAHLWTSALPLVAFGTQEQKAAHLPGLCDGSRIGGNAMSEPESGSDAFALRSRAQRKGDRWVLNGQKTFVTNAPVADLLVVFATIDPAKGQHGVTAFLVDTHAPGVEVGRPLEKMGLRTSPMAEVFFADCEIPEDRLLGKEGGGANVFSYSMAWERSCILASAVGSMQRLLEACLRHARERKQFGEPIGKFQHVAGRIVDMKLRLETARQMLYHGAWQRSRGKLAMLEAALTKLHLSECWVRCCEDAIQIHGGYGYMTEYELEREMRDALGSRLYSGTSEIQRTLIAGLLGL